jgi:hypothetical protein
MSPSNKALILLSLAASTGADFCGMLTPHLPSECGCGEQQYGASVGCAVDLFGQDTVGIYANLNLCGEPATADILVNDTKFHVSKELAGLHAGKAVDFPVPGLSIDIPDIGSVGVDLAFDIEGDLDEMEIKLGLDACGKVLGEKVCGSDLWSKLPLEVIDHTFNFGSLCKQAMDNAANVTLSQQQADHSCTTDADCAGICSYCMNGDGKQPPFVCHAPQNGCCTSDLDCKGSYCMDGPAKTPPFHCHGSLFAATKQ